MDTVNQQLQNKDGRTDIEATCPYYINTDRLVDLLSSSMDGYSSSEEIEKTVTYTQKKSRGLKGTLEKSFFTLSVEGDNENQKSASETNKYTRTHTGASLLNNVIDRIRINDLSQPTHPNPVDPYMPFIYATSFSCGEIVKFSGTISIDKCGAEDYISLGFENKIGFAVEDELSFLDPPTDPLPDDSVPITESRNLNDWAHFLNEWARALSYEERDLKNTIKQSVYKGGRDLLVLCLFWVAELILALLMICALHGISVSELSALESAILMAILFIFFVLYVFFWSSFPNWFRISTRRNKHPQKRFDTIDYSTTEKEIKRERKKADTYKKVKIQNQPESLNYSSGHRRKNSDIFFVGELYDEYLYQSSYKDFLGRNVRCIGIVKYIEAQKRPKRICGEVEIIAIYA